MNRLLLKLAMSSGGQPTLSSQQPRRWLYY